MSDDLFTEVSYQSPMDRLKNSIMTVLIGVVLFLIAFPLLWWNEGRAVQTAKSLDEGAGAVVSASPEKVNSANEGKLIHLTGEAKTDETLTDSQFGVSACAIRLSRNVEMYQWEETKTTNTRRTKGGGQKTTTTYSYERVWSDRPIKSFGFAKPDGHQNPSGMPYRSTELTSNKVTLGAFNLSTDQSGRIDNWETIPTAEGTIAGFPEEIRSRTVVRGDHYFIYEHAADTTRSEPKIGDLRVSFSVVKPTTVSLIACQMGDSFGAYQTEAGDQLDMIKVGTHSADSLFQAAMAENRMLTWILRAVGFVAMLVGVAMVFNPLAVLADFVPLLGDLMRAGTGLLAFAVATPLSLLAIAGAWVFYRPLIGVCLFVVAAVVLGGAGMMLHKKAASSKRICTT